MIIKPSESKNMYVHTQNGPVHVCQAFGKNKCNSRQVKHFEQNHKQKRKAWSLNG
jgi:hypothetical protein